MKRALAILLAAAIAVGLCACGGASTAQETTSKTTEGTDSEGSISATTEVATDTPAEPSGESLADTEAGAQATAPDEVQGEGKDATETVSQEEAFSELAENAPAEEVTGGDISNLPYAKAAKELTWGKWFALTGEAYTLPGYISFKVDEGKEDEYNQYEVSYYRMEENGETLVYSTTCYSYGGYGENIAFIVQEWESGTYYFTVTPTGDGINSQTGETVKSDTWEYTKPSQSLEAPSELSWEESKATWGTPWTNSAKFGGYIVQFYYAETEEGEKIPVGSQWVCLGRAFSKPISDYDTSEHGNGYYFFKVKLLSEDITRNQNSGWSDYSPAYYLTGADSGAA